MSAQEKHAVFGNSKKTTGRSKVWLDSKKTAIFCIGSFVEGMLWGGVLSNEVKITENKEICFGWNILNVKLNMLTGEYHISWRKNKKKLWIGHMYVHIYESIPNFLPSNIYTPTKIDCEKLKPEKPCYDSLF